MNMESTPKIQRERDSTTQGFGMEDSTIKTLIPDIYDLVQRKDGWFNAELAQSLSGNISARLQTHFNDSIPRRGSLRLSRLGDRCPCALWYEVHHPELAEPLPPWALIKYSYGHVLEAMAIGLAKAAGHEVTGEQDELVVDGIVGHRDCVIDGCVVDVKSCSSRQYEKYKRRTIATDDLFGYLDQLDGYVVGSLMDPLVRVHDKGYILAIDKTLGHMVLYEHTVREEHIRNRIRLFSEIAGRSNAPPCECGTRPSGGSGNVELDVKASYSPYKYCCRPLLRTFLYADGVKYLTKVVRKPDVTEIDRYGKVVYN